MNEELKPCKCGKLPLDGADSCKNDCGYIIIECSNCKASVKEHYEFDDEGYSTKFDAKQKAIEAWNKRHEN